MAARPRPDVTGFAAAQDLRPVMWQTTIHIIFTLSARGIAWNKKMLTGSSKREQLAH